MYRIHIAGLFCLALTAACNRAALPAATPVVNTEITAANGVKMLIGHCSLNRLQEEAYAAWYRPAYNAYQVDSAAVSQLASLLQPVTIEVFLGTWCGDSRRELPRLVKILEAARFDTAKLHLVFVNNAAGSYKQSPQHEEEGRFIHHVPTIILYKGREKGRIVESPVVSLEKDMLSILSGATYTPHYAATAFLQQRLSYTQPFSAAQQANLCEQLKPLCTNSRELNTLGYVLLGRQQYMAACNVLQLNTLLYPQDANVFDSLAEAYARSGNKAQARFYYRKVLNMKPGDENAGKQLALLQ